MNYQIIYYRSRYYQKRNWKRTFIGNARFWLLGVWLLGFKGSWLQSFLVAWLPGIFVSSFLRFLVSPFIVKSLHSRFQNIIRRISNDLFQIWFQNLKIPNSQNPNLEVSTFPEFNFSNFQHSRSHKL